MPDDILTEWQKHHAELLGTLLGRTEMVISAAAPFEDSLPTEVVRELKALAAAYTAYSEHSAATIEAAEDLEP